MPKSRFALILALVLVAGAATVVMAVAFAGTGAPVWLAAMGPILLLAALVAHLRRRRP
ncbi:hypothetical protein OEZ60_20700 [Defluviimonas sp. WL0024]|uniref:MYXO-CTERM domain-containing protein n=1 Tax=Albidovulum salinarum TaxID=2984153 RepID=A0ABT2X8X9_9RHOB|nr:hypothetical protein [Defluviimonas sp. WL0024]MCU9850407.1 hypothetical protein [Defluviimonas sp. WL0024]